MPDLSIPPEFHLSEAHRQALGLILTMLADMCEPWAITGSLGFALQGVPVPVHDIDLQATKPDAYEIERCLGEYTVEIVRFLDSGNVCSYLGRFAVGAVEVEVIGDIQNCRMDGSWSDPSGWIAKRVWLAWEGQRVPVLDLRFEHRAYLAMGWTERAGLLQRWLEERGINY